MINYTHNPHGDVEWDFCPGYFSRIDLGHFIEIATRASCEAEFLRILNQERIIVSRPSGEEHSRSRKAKA
jgi:hypothetical protein